MIVTHLHVVEKNSNFSNVYLLFSETVMLFPFSPWVEIMFVTFISTVTKIETAIAPPPWSDPLKNPCAQLPGGWQLLYWPPLKQCFKIFQVRQFKTKIIPLNTTNILTSVRISMP